MMNLCWWCGGKLHTMPNHINKYFTTLLDGAQVEVHDVCKPEADESNRRLTAAPPAGV